MRIITISRQYYPYGMASVNRQHCYNKGYNELGIETRFIIPEATIPFNERETTQNKLGEGMYNGTYFKYMSGTPIRNKNKCLRPFDDIISRTKTLIYLWKECNNETVVYLCGGTIIMNRIIQIIAHIKKAVVFAEVNEYPYATERETKMLCFYRYLMLTYVFPNYDGLIAISDTLVKVCEKYNKKKNCVIKVPIIVDSNISDIDEMNIEVSCPFIFHSGSLCEQKDGIVKMLTAFALAKEKYEIGELKFYLTGKLEGSRDEKQIREVISKYKIDEDVCFLGYLDNDLLRQYQKSCTMMIIYKYDTVQNKYCFSTKLGEYLSFAKPVILTNIGEATNYMKDGQNAFVVNWEDVGAIADNIAKIIINPEMAKHIGEMGKLTCVRDFDYQVHTRRMIDFFRTKMVK